MSVTFGFYSSLNGDRRYSAEQISAIFDGIISDGVYSTIGKHLVVRENDSMDVIVGSGRCWFNHTWTLNDIDFPLTLSPSEQILDRIDSVVLEVDSSSSSRRNRIYIIKGTPSSAPVPPSLQKQGPIYQYSLADIRVSAKATSIHARDITNNVGTSKCPFVTGVLTSVTVDEILTQWEDEWNIWFNKNVESRNKILDDMILDMDTQIKEYLDFIDGEIARGNATINDFIAAKQVEFETWFESIQDQLSGDVATNLTNKVSILEEKNAVMMHMIINNEFFAPIVTPEFTIVDDTGNAVIGDWEYCMGGKH